MMYRLVWVALLLLLSACGQRATTTIAIGETQPNVTVHFPRQAPVSPPPPYPASFMTGRLVVVDNCIHLQSLDGQYSTVPIWPAAYTLVNDGDKLAIQDDTGKILAHIGDQVKVGGAGIAAGPTAWRDYPMLREGPPAECAGPYWLASREFTRDNP